MRSLIRVLRKMFHLQGGGSDDCGGSGESRRLVQNADGTVTDTQTKLMWQAQSDGEERSHKQAIDYCRRLTVGGYSDWRLPNLSEIDELESALLEYAEDERPISFDWRNTWTASHGSEYGYAGDVFLISDHTTMFPQNHFRVLAARSSSRNSRGR